MLRRSCWLTMSIAAVLCMTSSMQADEKPAAETEDGWVSLFNGKDFSGWKISDDGKWRIEDGSIVANGPRSHLFTEQQFKDFEFKADVMTTPGSNAGIYFHTKYQETGWPDLGHEVQVNVSHRDPVKSGSLYNVVKLFDPPVKDNEWYETHIIVKGQNVTVKLNGEIMYTFVEPAGLEVGRKISHGSFALQAHDPKSVVYFKNLRVKSLGPVPTE